jgi:hypothetical protein
MGLELEVLEVLEEVLEEVLGMNGIIVVVIPRSSNDFNHKLRTLSFFCVTSPSLDLLDPFSFHLVEKG